VNINDDVVVSGNFASNGASNVMAGNASVGGNLTVSGSGDIAFDLTCGDITCNALYGGVVMQLQSNFATKTQLNTKALLSNPTFTGTVSGISESMIGLPNVVNTSDANIPISTATQTALNLKANQSATYTKTEVDSALPLVKKHWLFMNRLVQAH
jgi:hypothetical protein